MIWGGPKGDNIIAQRQSNILMLLLLLLSCFSRVRLRATPNESQFFFFRMEFLRLHRFVKDSCWLYLSSLLFTASLVLLKLFFCCSSFLLPIIVLDIIYQEAYCHSLQGSRDPTRYFLCPSHPTQRDVLSFLKTVRKNFSHTLHLKDNETNS